MLPTTCLTEMSVMQSVETIGVTAFWSIDGASSARSGSKSFSMNVDCREPAELIEERARTQALSKLAQEQPWPVDQIKVTVRVTRFRPLTVDSN